MLRSIIAAVFVCFAGLITPAVAQSWVQVEALPNLREAEARARAYNAELTGVNGFALRSGWYALAIGPFETAAEARAKLRELRRAGIIPRDSYVSDSSPYRQQFWPIGGATAVAPAPEVVEAPVEEVVEAPAPAPEPTPIVELDETPREARAS